MDRVAVSSSNLLEVGWEPGPPPSIGTLEVLFRSGALYRYSGVPPTVAFAVITGQDDGSVGRSFHTYVRLGGFPFERISPSGQ